jgi:ribonuclease G
LPGRYLVFMPTVDHIGVSRRIKDEKERRRLREIVQTMKPPSSGFIVRTASEGAEPDEIRNDMDFLLRLWNNIQKKTRNPNICQMSGDRTSHYPCSKYRSLLDFLFHGLAPFS